MSKGRLEAFSDGVIAILITIMVLELKVPHGDDLHALHDVWPKLLSYLVSFVYLGIYWNNHHHMLHAAGAVNGRILWANLHLLFWLSLVPVTTGWAGEHPTAELPAAVYAGVLLLAGFAYRLLQNAIVAAQGPDSTLATAIGRDRKVSLSVLLYLLAVPLAFVQPWVTQGLVVVVALVWLVPDRRIESQVHRK